MGGFGSGPFGRDPFGEWGWARNVLYESTPNIYRQADPANDFLLKKYAEGQYYSFENLRHHIQQYGSLRDAFTVRSEYSETEFVVLGKEVPLVGDIEQAGNLGLAVTLGVFKANDRTARFSDSDIGKQLYIRRSNVPQNNGQTFNITGIVSSTELVTDPSIAIDPGPLRWEIRAPATLPEGEIELEIRGGDPSKLELGWVFEDGSKQYDVVSRQMYWQPVTTSRLLNERESSDGVLSLAAVGAVQAYTLYSPSYAFQQTDVGKQLLVSGTPESDGLWEIVAVEPVGPSGANVAVFGKLTVPGLNGDSQGKTDYVYAETADLRVTVAHVFEQAGNLPLSLSYSTVVPGRFDVTVRLATDAGANITTIPSQIGAAITADPVISKYVRAGRGHPTGDTTVAEFSRTPIKPGKVLPQSSTAFWSLRPFARVVITGPVPLGVIDDEGFDLLTAGVHPTPTTTTVSSASLPFQSEDVGRLLTIRGSSVGNDGTYEIVQFNSTSSVDVAGVLLADATERYWCRRTAPINLPAPTRLNPQNFELTAHAPPLLDRLAYDFGIRVDTQQVEERQRAWVRQLPNWIAVKGTAQSIIDVAHLSGFQASVASLYSLPVIYDVFAGVNLYFLPDDGRPQSVGGSLLVSGASVHYSDPGFTFTAADVGRVIYVNGAASSANNNYFAIQALISSTVVRLVSTSVGGSLGPVTTLVAPDANNGSLLGVVGSVFSDTPYALPKYDDVNYDQLAVACDICGLGVNRPGIDTPALNAAIVIGNSSIDPAAVSTNPGNAAIISVTSVGLNHTVQIQGDDPAMILGGNWRMEDSVGNNYFYLATGITPTVVSLGAPVVVAYTDLYSMPQTVTTYPNAVYELTVTANVPPALGDVAFTYIPDVEYGCDNCATYRVAIELIADKVLSEGILATSQAFERCISLLSQVIPANAEPIYRLTLPLAPRAMLTGVSSTLTVTP